MTKMSHAVFRFKASMPWGFVAAAAVAAAALIDPVVEGLSNGGFFGPGRFTDASNADVIPALCVAAVLFCGAVVSMTRTMFSQEHYPPQWLRRCARELHATSFVPLLPAIFALQLLSLFAMETVEQIVTAGHPLGGFIWLGGPVVVSIAMHLIGCILVTMLLSKIVTVSARTVARILHLAIAVLRRISATAPSLRLRFRCALTPHEEPCRRASRGRAPPLFLSADPAY
jgi:hypothetical protein